MYIHKSYWVLGLLCMNCVKPLLFLNLIAQTRNETLIKYTHKHTQLQTTRTTSIYDYSLLESTALRQEAALVQEYSNTTI
jgi:hypothetical protein